METKKVFDLIDKFNNLNLKYDNVNHPEKLETFKSLSESLKQDEKSLSKTENENQFDKTLKFLLSELQKVSSKDVIRKLIIKCINIITKSKVSNEKAIKHSIDVLKELLYDPNEIIGQKLFIINVYLENLEQFGINCIGAIKIECLELLNVWSRDLKNELKISTAPIAISKAVQSLQLLFKTLIIFIQRCFNKDDAKSSKIKDIFESFQKTVQEILDFKDAYNMELGYAASMIYILLKSFESKEVLRQLIENCLKSYENNDSIIKIGDLCFFQAIFTMLKAQQILGDNLIDLFQKILIFTLNKKTESSDVSHSIAVSRTVNFWVIKLNEMINETENQPMQFLVDNESEWFDKLITFVWCQFDSNIDVIKNTSLQNYKLLLKAAKFIKKETVEKFYENELKKCMQISWQKNSKLNALIALLDSAISANDIMKFNPNIPEEIIQAVTERSTACLVSDMYSRLMKAHHEDISKTNESIEKWCMIWWSPIVKALESKDKAKKSYTYEYILPRIMRIFPDGMTYCQKISKNYSTIVSCTKVCRSLGLLSSQEHKKSSDKVYLFGSVDADILEKSIIYHDDQIRLDSLALICENPKTTEPILSIELELIKKFMFYNCDSLSTSFRQSVVASIKKLFFRLKESWIFQSRLFSKTKAKNNFKNDLDLCSVETVYHDLTTLYKDFIKWLFKFIFESTHLDSTFAKRNQNLLILTLFIDIVGYKCADEDNMNNNNTDKDEHVLFEFNNHIDRNRLLTLIECLWDTYPNNKNLALSLLIKIDQEIFTKNDFSAINYYNKAINLLSSRKPIDSMTSVYLMMFLQHKSTLNDYSTVSDPPKEAKSLSIYLVKSIENEFKVHCEQAKNNLLLAALEKPVYGPLAAIKSLIVQSVEEIKKSDFLSEWKAIIGELIDACFEVSKVVSQIVNSSSPEGIFPTELVSMQPEIVNSDLLKSVTPQMLLVCCWRTMKEISLFFGDLIKYLPIEHECRSAEHSYILSHAQVTKIGDYFVKHLFETRHRGAFELAYIGFTSMCETFWKCNSALYCEQPSKWLDFVLELIQTKESKSKLISTRRGGGLPFFVQAIVGTELPENGKKSLAKSMKVLLSLAETKYDNEEENFSQVLSMYILSALFKDTRVGEDVLQYAESALIIAINGFDSAFWNIRNSSTLLFSSLINRIFGVNRSKEEISKKNSMPGRMFFSKFPRLFQFFEQIILDSIQLINTHLNSKLYLVTLILTHLFTLGDELSDPEALLHYYIPNLLRCCKSPVMKTRVFIAKAISSIVNLDRYPLLVKDIFDNYLKCDELNSKKDINSNYMHGLFEVLNILAKKNNIFQFISFETFMSKLEPLSQIKHCPINYATFLNLLGNIYMIGKDGVLSQEQKIKLIEFMSKLQMSSINSLKSGITNEPSLLLPGAHDLSAKIGEITCMLVLAIEDLKCDRSSSNLGELSKLIDSNIEYSMNLMRGCINFINANKPTIDCLNRIMYDLFHESIFNSIFKWNVFNHPFNLRISCDLLTILIKTNMSLIDQNNVIALWKSLVESIPLQTESETRICILNLLTHIFPHVNSIKSIEALCFDSFMDSLESYLDRSDESLCLSNFLNHNLKFIFIPANESYLGSKLVKFWNLLMQLLVQVDQECCVISCNILASISNECSTENREPFEESKFDSIAMVKLGLDLFIKLFYEKYPLESIEFLIDQFEFVSECESSSSENEEELEVVFDKGVESIHFIFFQYLNELVRSLELLLFDLKTNKKQNGQNEIDELFAQKFKFICGRLDKELNIMLEHLKLDKMCYNDIKYTKISSHYNFVKNLGKFTSGLDHEIILSKFINHNAILNCFLN